MSPVFAPLLGIETTGKVTRYGLARAAQAMGDQVVAQQLYKELVALRRHCQRRLFNTSNQGLNTCIEELLLLLLYQGHLR